MTSNPTGEAFAGRPLREPEGLDRRTLVPLLGCFGERERRILERLVDALKALPPRTRSELHGAFRSAAQGLPPLVRALESAPIGMGPEQLGSRTRSAESLISAFCAQEWLPSRFVLPTGAVVGQTLVLARVNFLKALRYSLEASDGGAGRELVEDLEEAIGDAVSSQLAEELLTATASNTRNADDLRRAAARKLLRLWSDRLQQPVGDFPSVLLSAWKARRKVQAVYGSLLGSQELLSLLQQACEERFVNYFTRAQVTPGEMDSFREFLFGLPYEDLQRVQAHMSALSLRVISPKEVRRLLGNPPVHGEGTGHPSAEEMYSSYYRRRVRAEYRALSSSPGPHKTAEGYIMEVVLREEIEDEKRHRRPR